MSKPRFIQNPTVTAAEQAEINRALQECYGHDIQRLAVDAGVSESTVRRISRYNGIPFKRGTIYKIVQAARKKLGEKEPQERALGELLTPSEPLSTAILQVLGEPGALAPSKEAYERATGHAKASSPESNGSTKIFTDLFSEADKLNPNPPRYIRTSRPRYSPADASHPAYEEAYAAARADLLDQLQEQPELQQQVDRVLGTLAQLDDQLGWLRSRLTESMAAQRPRLISIPQLNVSEDPHGWSNLPMDCPVCRAEKKPFDYNHISGVRVAQGSDVTIVTGDGTRLERQENSARGSLVTIAFRCEGGHHFCLDFQFHKGQVFVWAEKSASPDWLRDSGELWRD